MTLQQLLYVLTVSDEKSMNKAAEKLFVSQPTLTSAIQSLEKELDILGIAYKNVSLSDEDKEIYHKWEEAKKAKDFTAADEMREKLMERGIL